MKEVVDQRVVHRAAELRVRMQHQRHGRAGGFLPLIARLDATGGTGENDVGHSCFQVARIVANDTKPTGGVRILGMACAAIILISLE